MTSAILPATAMEEERLSVLLFFSQTTIATNIADQEKHDHVCTTQPHYNAMCGKARMEEERLCSC